jgi:hypothetical protein
MKALEKGISLHAGPVGEPGRGLVYRRHRKMNKGGFWKRSISLCGSYMRVTWRGDSYTGHPNDKTSTALEMGVCFHSGPVSGNMGGRSFRIIFDRREQFNFYREEIY